MDMDIVQVVSQVGFPIAVACYSLIVLNKSIKENTLVMVKISEKIEGCEKR